MEFSGTLACEPTWLIEHGKVTIMDIQKYGQRCWFQGRLEQLHRRRETG